MGRLSFLSTVQCQRIKVIPNVGSTTGKTRIGLVFVRDMLGKKTGVNHFCNEHLFVNRALTGEWKPLDETELDTYDLRLLKAIRERNTLLIQHYPVQKDRKELMDKFVAEYRVKHPRLQLVSEKPAKSPATNSLNCTP